MSDILKILFRTLLLAIFAVWFGGFMFYVSFVVPIGNEVLGSAREQGFITRLVTHRLNVMCAVTVVVMMAEWYRSRQTASNWIRRSELGSIIVIGLTLLLLVLVHPRLDSMLDVAEKRVHGRAEFYQLHRVYLWVSTVQWGVAWVWLVAVVRKWQVENWRLVELSNRTSD